MQAVASLAMKDLLACLGREESMHSVHAGLLRTAQALRPVVESGCLLASCSDEFNGELRSAFVRDVARQLSAPDIPGRRRVFAVSNLGGRIEPGATALADLHFTSRSRTEGQKLLVVEIAAHVGRLGARQGAHWGELDRFGTVSPCCGALRLLLDDTSSAASVRFPWFDQLTAFFGPARLASLRADTGPFAMLRAAAVHAVLQSETAIVDLLRQPPAHGTHVLLLAMVVINRRGPDNAIPVGIHHLHFENGEARIIQGTALRSTPEEIRVDTSRAMVTLSSPFESHPPEAPRERTEGAPSWLPDRTQERARESDVHEHLARARRQFDLVKSHPHATNVYARAALRAFVQGLSLVAPEVALATLALESGREILRAKQLDALVRRGPSSAEARQVLHDLEPSLQQLGHLEAREVLHILLSRQHPLLGGRA